MKKELKLKCQCFAGETLYIGDFQDGQVYVAIDNESGRKNKKRNRHLPEVIVNRKDLLEWLR